MNPLSWCPWPLLIARPLRSAGGKSSLQILLLDRIKLFSDAQLPPIQMQSPGCEVGQKERRSEAFSAEHGTVPATLPLELLDQLRCELQGGMPAELVSSFGEHAAALRLGKLNLVGRKLTPPGAHELRRRRLVGTVARIVKHRGV